MGRRDVHRFSETEWGDKTGYVPSPLVFVLYKLSGKLETSESPAATVKWFGKTRVEVEADVPPINTQVSY